MNRGNNALALAGAPGVASPEAMICIFAKPPRAGQVKTRLAAAIGDDRAAALARAFLDDTVDAVRSLPWATAVLATTELFEARLPLLLQGEGDLGARIERVMRAALSSAGIAIAIGADAPALPRRLLEAARAALDHSDAALGPAEDGGFYLLALRRCPEGLLAGLPWSADDTCAKTLVRLQERGFRVALLEPWFDVDRPADLDRLRAAIAAGEIVAPRTAAALGLAR
jgi:rSAM/selenodomain-associated transferase 1